MFAFVCWIRPYRFRKNCFYYKFKKMLIVGAKGFAKEVLEILHQLNETKNLVFYDDVNNNSPDLLFNCFPVIKNIDDSLIKPLGKSMSVFLDQ